MAQLETPLLNDRLEISDEHPGAASYLQRHFVDIDQAVDARKIDHDRSLVACLGARKYTGTASIRDDGYTALVAETKHF